MCNNHKSSVLSSSLALTLAYMKKKDIGNYFGDKTQSFEHRVAIFSAKIWKDFEQCCHYAGANTMT